MKFWLLQTLGWLLFFVIQLLLRNDDAKPWLLHSLMYAGALTFLALLGSLGLRQCYRKLSASSFGALAWFASCFLASLLAAMMVDVAHHIVLHGFAALSPLAQSLADDQPLGARVPFVLPAYWIWSLLYVALSRQEHLLRSERQQQQLQLALHELQLHSLLAQLNPHFMFNTLNNIRALILKDSEAARTALAHFADVLRYQLDIADSALVTVADEMQLVQDYLSLVRLQLGKRLLYSEQIADASLTWPIPRLAIQLLVENAVKHGLSGSTTPGELHIETQATATVLTIQVRNSGQLASASESETTNNKGVGIANLRRRLALAFAERGQLALKQDGQHVLATIVIEKAP